jgi:hypothetical protein
MITPAFIDSQRRLYLERRVQFARITADMERRYEAKKLLNGKRDLWYERSRDGIETEWMMFDLLFAIMEHLVEPSPPLSLSSADPDPGS